MRANSFPVTFAAVAALASLGCFTGPGADTYRPAITPSGAEVRVRAEDTTISGELLEVRDSGIVVMPPDDIVYISFAAIDHLSLRQERIFYSGGEPKPDVRERLRLISRFPGGLPPEHLERLLGGRGKSSLRPIGGPEAHLHRAPASAVPVIASDEMGVEATFLAAARAATARYRDLDSARADGYRRVGGELPSLGEHWVHNGRALADSLDPARPAILVYLYVDGRAILAGCAYTRFLGAGEPYPSFPATARDAWHEHNGSVADEILPAAHHVAVGGGEGGGGLRIAVMHAWAWVANPAGVWAAENWALPYLRAGLSADRGAGGREARGLSLATSAEYYLRAIAATADLTADEARRVHDILSAHATRSAAAARHIAAEERDPLHQSSRDRSVGALWDSAWNEIMRAVGADTAAQLERLREALTGDAR
jgi:hypothetical protein